MGVFFGVERFAVGRLEVLFHLVGDVSAKRGGIFIDWIEGDEASEAADGILETGELGERDFLVGFAEKALARLQMHEQHALERFPLLLAEKIGASAPEAGCFGAVDFEGGKVLMRDMLAISGGALDPVVAGTKAVNGILRFAEGFGDLREGGI
jgi:hypothetical protein